MTNRFGGMGVADWTQICETCGFQDDLRTVRWQCHLCGSAFHLGGHATITPENVLLEERSIWRYGSVLPVGRQDAVSLGEGLSPRVSGTILGRRVWFKCDGLLPSGSFKDRGAAVFVSYLRSRAVQHIVLDSSGNAAAAMACYSAAAGIDCTVYAPASTSAGKLVQARAYGAHVVEVPGLRAAATSAAIAAAGSSQAFYASHNWHPVVVAGTQTLALEIWEQLGWRLPRIAVIPTGGGSAYVGAHWGFEAVVQGGRLPILIAAQPSACARLALVTDESDAIPSVEPGETIAEGTKTGTPQRPRQILTAMRRSNGWAEAVTDAELLVAMKTLWRQGLYVEPTAALGAAALARSIERGLRVDHDEAVVLLTGSGLKSTDKIGLLLDETH